MTFSLGAFVVCILIVLILWLIAEYVIKYWFTGPGWWPHLGPLVRLIFAILVILCILHALGVVQMPVTLT